MARSQTDGVLQFHGRQFGLAEAGNLVANGVPLNNPAVQYSATISAEGATVANQRDISIQVKDAEGRNIDYVCEIELVALLNAGGTDYAATGGSTGIAAGAAGKILAQVAKKSFRCLTNAAGLLSVIYTDTGTEAVFLGVKLPNGRLTVAGDLTNA